MLEGRWQAPVFQSTNQDASQVFRSAPSTSSVDPSSALVLLRQTSRAPTRSETFITQMTQTQVEEDPRTYAIIGAAIEVHRHLGHGFLEAVYQEALAVEFQLTSVPFRLQVELPIYYKDKALKTFYRADFICFGDVVVELKALRALTGSDDAQVINYLKASRLTTGLLLNFGGPWLEHKRFIYSSSASSASSVD